MVFRSVPFDIHSPVEQTRLRSDIAVSRSRKRQLSARTLAANGENYGQVRTMPLFTMGLHILQDCSPVPPLAGRAESEPSSVSDAGAGEKNFNAP